jgi:hypothetical protein
VVPELEPEPLVLSEALLLPPQPLAVEAKTTKSNMPMRVCHLRRRMGSQIKNSAASVALPPTVNKRWRGPWSAAVDRAVVRMESVAVTACVLEIAAG